MKKHTTSNKNHKSPINRGVKNHTFKFVKHTYESFNKNLHNLKAKFNRFKFTNYIKNTHRLTTLGLTSSCLLVLLILAICIPLYKDELNTKATTGTSTQATTSLALSSGASSTASIDVLATSSSGTFASSSDSGVGNGSIASYTVTTNNSTGYTLLMASTSSSSYNNGLLTNPSSNTTLSSISTITQSNGFSNGEWGFLPSKYCTGTTANTCSNNTNNNYLPAPNNTDGRLLDITTTANSTGTYNTYTIGIGAKVDQTQIAGTYTSDPNDDGTNNYTPTYMLQAVGNLITYTINYADNTSDSTVANMPSTSTTGNTSTTSITLNSTVPTRTGYTFSKWCLGTVSNNGTTCAGTQYSSGATFGIDQTTTNTTTLYAVWIASKYDITLTNTNATTNGSTSAYTTYNSSNVYAGTASSSGTSTITSPQRSYTVSGFSKTASANNASVNNTTTKTYTYVFDGWYTASSGGNKVITSSGTLVANAKASDNTTTLVDSNGNWVYDTTSSPAVTLYAHWTNGSGITLSTITQTNGTCGWTTSNSATASITYSSGYTSLVPTSNMTLYGVCNFKAIVNFTANTGISSVQIRTASGTGGTLKGTIRSSGGSVANLTYNTTYYLYPTFSSGYKIDNWKKTSTYGTLAGTATQNTTTTTNNPAFTVGTSTTTAGPITITLTGKISTTTFAQAYASAGKTQTSGYYKMQDMSKSICSSVTDGQTATLRDTRSTGYNYTVAKIGNLCWMTQNLMLGSSSTVALTSATSNVSSSGYTLPARGTSGTSYSGQYVWGNDTQCTSSSTTACAGYYSYATATAGTNPSSGTSSYDICPANWRLPTSAELTTLEKTYTSGATLTASPFLGVYAGRYNNSSFYDGGSVGYYWSSTAYNSSLADRLYFGSSSAGINGTTKYYGYSIRCVAKS